MILWPINIQVATSRAQLNTTSKGSFSIDTYIA